MYAVADWAKHGHMVGIQSTGTEIQNTWTRCSECGTKCQNQPSMNGEDVAVAAVIFAACTSAIIAVADGRSIRSPASCVATFHTTTFEQALCAKDTTWFHKKLRCDKTSFLRILAIVRSNCHCLPGRNSKHGLSKRLALTMMYLAQGSTIDASATAMGISKSRAVVYINEMLAVLKAMAKTVIVMPSSDEQEQVESGFYSIAGFPGVVGAVDGTLVKVMRPHEYEGWYCRKNYPAVNVQAIVDHLGLFRSISIRSGSNNDQSLWNGSGVHKR